MGGTLACWNHPFELARILGQKRAAEGSNDTGLSRVIIDTYRDYGITGLYRGLFPRVCLGIWQTLMMVTAATMIKEKLISKGWMH